LLEQQLERLPDSAIIQKALTEDRIILAHDLDFCRLLALSGASGPSLITFRLANMRPENVLFRLMPVLRDFESDLNRGAALTITDRGVRRHMLPLRPASDT
jgi:predicted nuclease of predicted toxin-antitoxin system